MTETVILSELARRIGRDKSQLSRMARDGRLPKEKDGRFDEAKVRAHFEGYVDPSRRKPLRGGQQSTPGESTINDALTRAPLPDPDTYRRRDDLPDDFIRGALFACHFMAYSGPTEAAFTAVQAGASARVGFAAYGIARADAEISVTSVCVVLGLLPDMAVDPGPYGPSAFCGVNPVWLAQEAGEQPDLPAWEAFARLRQEPEAA